MLSILSYVCGISICPPWRTLCSGLFFNWVVCLPAVELCEWSHMWYILEKRLLSEVSLANMISHTVGSLFILMLFPLAMHKLFNYMRSHLFILSFMSLALGDTPVKILLHGISEISPPMLYSRTFKMSWLIFKAFIHLELIFVYGVRW